MSAYAGYTLSALYRVSDRIGDRLAEAELQGLEDSPRYAELEARFELVESLIAEREAAR